MVKQIFPAIVVVFFLSSCSTFKPLNFTSNRQIATVPAPNLQSKFIDDISVTPAVNVDKTEVKTESQLEIVSSNKPWFE